MFCFGHVRHETIAAKLSESTEANENLQTIENCVLTFNFLAKLCKEHTKLVVVTALHKSIQEEE